MKKFTAPEVNVDSLDYGLDRIDYLTVSEPEYGDNQTPTAPPR